eukprot:9006897-Pyramimonas_sp.AAC.1
MIQNQRGGKEFDIDREHLLLFADNHFTCATPAAMLTQMMTARHDIACNRYAAKTKHEECDWISTAPGRCTME